jgi:hypothetical protein
MPTRNATLAAIVALAAIALLAVPSDLRADPVAPAACVITNLRDVADSADYASAVTFYQGDYVTFTNSLMYSDDGSTLQDLSNCVITVTLGNFTVSNSATGYTVNATGGVWGAEVIVPASDPCFIEVSASNTYNYTYPRQKIRTRAKLP